MHSSFRWSHRHIPSVTQLPSGVVICLSIHHCHINFWKQRKYGDGERIFSAKIPGWCTKMLQRPFTRSKKKREFRMKRNDGRVPKCQREPNSFWSRYVTICLMLIYRSQVIDSGTGNRFYWRRLYLPTVVFARKGHFFWSLGEMALFLQYLLYQYCCIRCRSRNPLLIYCL